MNSSRIFAYPRTDNRFTLSDQSQFSSAFIALLDHAEFTPHGVNNGQLLRDKIA